jgi:hypothetical protein
MVWRYLVSYPQKLAIATSSFQLAFTLDCFAPIQKNNFAPTSKGYV